MGNMQGWLASKPGRYALCIAVSVLMAGLVFQTRNFVAQRLLDHSLEALGHDVIRQIDAVLDSAIKTLDEADRSPHADCSAQDLAFLRTTLVRSKYIKDIGRLSGASLVCSSVLGVLATPDTPQQAPFVLNENLSGYWAGPLLSDSASLGMLLMRQKSNVLLDLDAFRVVRPHDLQYVLSLRDRPMAAVVGLNATGHPVFMPAKNALSTATSMRLCSGTYPLCVTTQATTEAHADSARDAAWLTAGVGALLGGVLTLVAFAVRRRWFSLPARMHRALGRGEFSVVYQPIVPLANPLEVTSAEALIRWNGGPTTPDVFIAAAERHGLIAEVTEFVVCTVLADMGEIFRAWPDFRVTINVSSPELLDGSLAESLERHWPPGLARRQIGFELTERSTAELQDLLPALQRLHNLGHVIYVDDFGTGYSSLSHLQHLPIDYIKVDRSLLPDQQKEAQDSLLPEILAIARRLDVGLVFEGVETEEQAQLLRDRSRVAFAQGWLFGRPGTPEALAKRLAEQEHIRVHPPSDQ
ncbi:EAL domain-containing protein [Pseudomonas aeruginosa]